jgi:hypothetical protein
MKMRVQDAIDVVEDTITQLEAVRDELREQLRTQDKRTWLVEEIGELLHRAESRDNNVKVLPISARRKH